MKTIALVFLFSVYPVFRVGADDTAAFHSGYDKQMEANKAADCNSAAAEAMEAASGVDWLGSVICQC